MMENLRQPCLSLNGVGRAALNLIRLICFFGLLIRRLTLFSFSLRKIRGSIANIGLLLAGLTG